MTREEITQAWRQFEEVWVKGDAAAAAQWYTEDAINMPPDVEDAQGRSEIQSAFSYIRLVAELGWRSVMHG